MESLQPVQFEHPLYKPCPLAEADGVAWIWPDTKSMIPTPFKFPPLKSGEIRGNIIYTGLCYTDVHQARGDLGAQPLPIVPGHEVYAKVTAVGPDVKNVKVGDRVGYGFQGNCCDKCEYCTSTVDNLCQSLTPDQYTLSNVRWGGYATAIQQPERFAIKIPDGVPDEDVPNLMCAGITLYAPIARHCKPGMKVAVLGIGGLGHMGVQFASKYGCHVTAFSGSPDKDGLIKSLGAENIINSKDAAAVKAARSQFDVVLNTLPGADGATNTAFLDLAKPNGAVVWLGLHPGTEFASLFPLVFKQINLVGSFIGSAKELREMLEFAAKHKIRPITEVFAFEDFPKAFDKLENGRPKFRCIVDCQAYAKKVGLLKNQDACCLPFTATVNQPNTMHSFPNTFANTYPLQLRFMQMEFICLHYVAAANPFSSITHSPVSYTHLRAHETDSYLVCRLLLEKKKKTINQPSA
eukprot:TRINITY_DN8509_c0_g1_i18.p1 TRINITY_DN8509_c0_g1~~TRINITY_DN8509_c0_g1_i18.p1  ORF type:complete len:464 (+),score=125.31 TRINITY_DN8509_c0_g1_i18:163-1554(+)